MVCIFTSWCQLFLHNRSSAVAYALRQLRTEGYLQLYIAKLCKVFFSNLKETLKEFETAFKDYPGCYSTFVVWSQTEIKVFDITGSEVYYKDIGSLEKGSTRLGSMPWGDLGSATYRIILEVEFESGKEQTKWFSFGV